MSVVGTKRTSNGVRFPVAIGGKADIANFMSTRPSPFQHGAGAITHWIEREALPPPSHERDDGSVSRP